MNKQSSQSALALVHFPSLEGNQKKEREMKKNAMPMLNVSRGAD